jgi:hypothetical protein
MKVMVGAHNVREATEEGRIEVRKEIVSRNKNL